VSGWFSGSAGGGGGSVPVVCESLASITSGFCPLLSGSSTGAWASFLSGAGMDKSGEV